MSWTQERVDLLTKLWAEGLSASDIANQLGHVTRNAVIGKVHRLTLPPRTTPPRPKNNRSRQRSDGTRRPRPRMGFFGGAIGTAFCAPHFEGEPFVPTTEELQIPVNERKTLQMLEDCDCRWPIGDPQHADFHFCNRKKFPGLSYCEFHAHRAFQPPQPRRRDEYTHETFMPTAAPVAVSSAQ